jgi:hypothetical protein
MVHSTESPILQLVADSLHLQSTFETTTPNNPKRSPSADGRFESSAQHVLHTGIVFIHDASAPAG